MEACYIPDEILVNIFMHCNIATLHNVMQSSRRFNLCANIDSVWKRRLRVLTSNALHDMVLKKRPERNYKDICRRFIQVFGHGFDAIVLGYSSTCASCHSPVCWCEQSMYIDREEIIVFDFGSKTTWFKYTGNAGTGQLSMHPTIGPVVESYVNTDVWELQVTGDESCPVCTRILFQRSLPSVDCSVQRLKKVSKFVSLRNLDCFGVTQNNDNMEPCEILPTGSTEFTWTAAETVDTYEFLIRHMLKRNPFFHVPDIPFVVCEPICCSQQIKRHLLELLLCQLKVPEVCFVPKPIAVALYAAIDTCLVVDSGANNTTVTPVINQCVIRDAVRHVPVGGSHLTQLLLDCIRTKGLEINVNEASINSSQVKRECYIAYNIAAEMKKKIPMRTLFVKGYRGSEVSVATVQLSHELYQAAENLYIRLDLPQLIADSLSTLSVPCQCRLLTNIILTGGNSRLSGLGPRLARDLQSLLPRTTAASVRVSDPRLMTGRSDAVIGAAYVRKWNHARWITRRDYILDGHGHTFDDDEECCDGATPVEVDLSTSETHENTEMSCIEDFPIIDDAVRLRCVTGPVTGCDDCESIESCRVQLDDCSDRAIGIASENATGLSAERVLSDCDGCQCQLGVLPSNVEEAEFIVGTASCEVVVSRHYDDTNRTANLVAGTNLIDVRQAAGDITLESMTISDRI